MTYKSTLQKLLFCLLFALSANYASAQCGDFGGSATVVNFGCSNATFSLGAGEKRTLNFDAGVYYDFSHNMNGNTQGNGYCINGTNYTSAQTLIPGNGDFRVGINRTVTQPFNTTSATFNYKISTPAVTSSNAAMCEATGSRALTGSAGATNPATISFSGTGVSGTTFTPPSIPDGTTYIDYSITPSNGGCNGTAQSIRVFNTLAITSANTDMCEGTGTRALTHNFASGVTFSGTGVSGTTFTPPAQANGITFTDYTITATYDQGAGSNPCGNTATQTIRVWNTLAITSASAVCEGGNIALTHSLASGVTFSGTGVSGTTFTGPAVPDGTTFTDIVVTATYNQGSGSNTCGNTATQTIRVWNTLTLTNSNAAMCEAVGTRTLTHSLASGVTFSGTGVSGTTFTPPAIANGTTFTDFTVTATYDQGSGSNSCGNTATQTIRVFNTLAFTSSNADMCEGGSRALTHNFASGVTFSGTGVSGTTFTAPAQADGTDFTDYTITATYDQGGGSNPCGNTATQVIRVWNTLTVTSSNANMCEGSTRALTHNMSGSATVNFSGTGVSGTTFTAPAQPDGTAFTDYVITATYTQNLGSNACGNTATQTIRVYNIPAATATDQYQCNSGNFTLNGNDPTTGTGGVPGATGTWSCVTNCGGVSITTPSQFNSAVTGVPQGGTGSTFTWLTSNAGQCTNSITITLRNDQPITISGSSQICDDNTGVTFTSSPSGGTGWTYTPTGSITSTGGSINGSGVLTPPDVTGSNATQTANITVSNGTCTSPAFPITIYNLPDNNTPTTSMCQGETRNLISSVTGVTWVSSPCPGCAVGSVFTAPNPGGASANYNITARNGGSFCASGAATITVYTVATITSSSADMCEGDVRTPLTANQTPGTFSGTGVVGTTFTAPSVSVPTTPYVIEYVLNGAPATCKATQTINVLNRSDNPTSASANPATPICNGSTVDLTLVGGGNGANENVRWYTGSPGGTLVGTGNPLTVTPPSNATTVYYGRYENGAPCSYTSSAQTVSVTTQTASSVAGASLTATPNLIECIGSSTTLNVVSGTLGASASWNLYSGSCGGTFIASNGTGIFNVTPTANTDYYVRAIGCNTTACVNVTVTANNPIDLIPATGTKTCTFDGTYSGEKFLVNSSNEALLSIDEGAVNLGSVTAVVTKHGSVPTIAGSAQCDLPLPSSGPVGGDELYLPREFDITTSNAPSGFVTVSLYFTQAELTALRNATLAASTDYQNCWGTVLNDGSNLMLTINHTDNTYETRTQGGGGLTLTTTGPNGSYKASFQVNKFSGFKLHGNGGVNGANGLPVEMIYFHADPVNNAFIQLTWATALEIDNDGFQVERSEDGQTWSNIGWVDGGNNSTVQLNYSFDDLNVVPGVRYYYRLKQVDNDGDVEYHGPETAILNGEITFDVMDLIPNPAINATTLIITAAKEQSITVDVYDVIGQKVSTQQHALAKRTNKIEIECSKFAAGTYTVAVTSGNQSYAKKLIITR